MKPYVEYLEITPQMAREMLGKSKGNPRWSTGKLVDLRQATKIANDILDGNWHLGSGDILFDEDGVLVDGHTRLTAITIANKAVPCFVKYGISKDGLLHIDDNRVRSDSQRLHTSATILGVATLQRCMIEGLPPRQARNLSTEQKKAFVDLHPCLDELYTVITKRANKRCLTKNSACLHAAMCAFEYGVSGTILTDFFTKVNSGFIKDSGESACVALRNYLERKAFAERDKELITVSVHTQQAIYDFVHGVVRGKAYRSEKTVGKNFSLNVNLGDVRYKNLLGENTK